MLDEWEEGGTWNVGTGHSDPVLLEQVLTEAAGRPMTLANSAPPSPSASAIPDHPPRPQGNAVDAMAWDPAADTGAKPKATDTMPSRLGLCKL